jgi:hypothetical protein
MSHLNPDETLARIAAHECLLYALALTHPDAKRLLRTYLDRVNGLIAQCEGDSGQFGANSVFVEQLRECAGEITQRIPAS